MEISVFSQVIVILSQGLKHQIQAVNIAARVQTGPVMLMLQTETRIALP